MCRTGLHLWVVREHEVDAGGPGLLLVVGHRGTLVVLVSRRCHCTPDFGHILPRPRLEAASCHLPLEEVNVLWDVARLRAIASARPAFLPLSTDLGDVSPPGHRLQPFRSCGGGGGGVRALVEETSIAGGAELGGRVGWEGLGAREAVGHLQGAAAG